MTRSIRTTPLRLRAAALAALAAGAGACTDVTTVPQSAVSSENVFNDAGAYQAAVAKLYGTLALAGPGDADAGSSDIQGIDSGFGQYLRAYLGFYTYNRVGAEATYSSLQQGGVARNVSALVYRYGFVNPQFNSELNVEKADFLRMDNLTLGYSLPRFGSLNATRVFATVQNAFTASGYSGVDPLAGGLGGIDNNAYPLSRILTLGFNVGF